LIFGFIATKLQFFLHPTNSFRLFFALKKKVWEKGQSDKHHRIRNQRLATMRPKLGHNETKGWSQRDQRLVTMRPKAGHDVTKKRVYFWSRENVWQKPSNSLIFNLLNDNKIKASSVLFTTKDVDTFLYLATIGVYTSFRICPLTKKKNEKSVQVFPCLSVI